jgi:hypothetical protein
VSLLYDTPIAYDTPDYTYDGFAVEGLLTIQEALYRELKFGPALLGLVPAARVKLDARADAETGGAYPWVVFRRITSSEHNRVRLARERWEIELIGSLSEAGADDLLQAAQEALLDHFAGKHRTWGSFTPEGEESDNGLRMKCLHVSTVELIDDALAEKAHVLIFLFTYVRATDD